MGPQIQYAISSDGVRIAFWTLGTGKPLMVLPMLPFSNVLLEWQFPERRAWYERLAQTRKLIRYDGRGTGLSEREVVDFSLESQLLDLEAVVDRLALDRLAIFAPFFAGPTAINYAAFHPERVSHLVLWCTFPRTSDYLREPQSQGIVGMVDKDWELFTETLAHVIIGWSKGEPAHRFASFMRECITQQTRKAALGGFVGHDATDFLPRVACPTLVIHRRQLRVLHPNFDQEIVSSIPDCRLMFLEGESGPPFVGDLDEVNETLFDFLSDEGPGLPQMGAGHTSPALLELLSPREIQVLRLIREGKSNQDIGEELVVTVGTVKAHLRNIYRKLVLSQP